MGANYNHLQRPLHCGTKTYEEPRESSIIFMVNYGLLEVCQLLDLIAIINFVYGT